MSKKPLPILYNIPITDAGSEGKSIAKVDKLVVFLKNAVPGDVVDIQLTRKKNSYAEGNAIHWHHYSNKRSEPFCEHFGVCGGCKWQFMQYEHQLFYKQKQVHDALIRLGKLDVTEINPILPSRNERYYRNKLEYTFSHKKWLTNEELANSLSFGEGWGEVIHEGLGFHVPGRFDKVLDIHECFLQPDLSNKIRESVKKYALENKISFFDLRDQNGLLRNLIIRNNAKGDWMVIVNLSPFPSPKERAENSLEVKQIAENILSFLNVKFPQITSLNYVINPKRNDTINDLEIICFKGNAFLMEEMEGIQFKIGPKSFFQTNTTQAYELYKITRDYAGLTGKEIVYDLYTGTGTIANFIASQAKKVIGIEFVPEAIEDAKENSIINKITNTSFFAGDMKDVLSNDFIAEHGTPDIIITDPPRAGMHLDVVNKILEIKPDRIVYVSCNPASQARDLAFMKEHYAIKKVQPVDMFPHTHHVENVVLLEKLVVELM